MTFELEHCFGFFNSIPCALAFPCDSGPFDKQNGLWIHKKYLPRESAARAMGLMLEWQMSLVRIGEIGVISMSQRGKFVPENGLQKTWLQNKLLLISINFTPKTSHSFRELWYTMFCRMLKIQPGLRHKNSNTTYSRCFPLTNFSVQSFKHWIRLIVTHFEALPCLG